MTFPDALKKLAEMEPEKIWVSPNSASYHKLLFRLTQDDIDDILDDVAEAHMLKCYSEFLSALESKEGK